MPSRPGIIQSRMARRGPSLSPSRPGPPQARGGGAGPVLTPEPLPGFVAVRRGHHLVAIAREGRLEEPARRGVVFGDQDTHGSSVFICRGGRVFLSLFFTPRVKEIAGAPRPPPP